MVVAGNTEAILLLMLGTEAADIVESVGEGASDPEVGGADVLVRRWEIVPMAGEVLISGGLVVGVASERAETVDPPLGRGVMKLPGLFGGGGDAGSNPPAGFRGVMASIVVGGGRGGRGGDDPYG